MEGGIFKKVLDSFLGWGEREEHLHIIGSMDSHKGYWRQKFKLNSIP